MIRSRCCATDGWAWWTGSPSTSPICLPGNATDATNFAAGEQPIFAGHAHALTFATQISKVETLRSELTFGQILRGLQVYGYQIVDGTALAEAKILPA